MRIACTFLYDDQDLRSISRLSRLPKPKTIYVRRVRRLIAALRFFVVPIQVEVYVLAHSGIKLLHSFFFEADDCAARIRADALSSHGGRKSHVILRDFYLLTSRGRYTVKKIFL